MEMLEEGLFKINISNAMHLEEPVATGDFIINVTGIPPPCPLIRSTNSVALIAPPCRLVRSTNSAPCSLPSAAGIV
jgi:hypothetical protein